jgi:hypothetical protein
MDLTSKSDKELQAIIQQVEIEEKKRKEENDKHEIQRTTEILQILKNSPDILNYIEHDRTSCSDNNLYNGYFLGDHAHCRKCFLLSLIRDNIYNYKISIKINFEEI